MMCATKIKMKQGCARSYDCVEIDQIYIEGADKEQFYTKASVYEALKENRVIKVKLGNYPNLMPVISASGEKYVRSEPNDTVDDNLLKLPRV